MKLKQNNMSMVKITFYILIFFSINLLGQEIFKDKIYGYSISLSKTKSEKFNLVVSKNDRKLLNLTFPVIQLYLYNLDSDENDELILVKRYLENADTLNTLLIYKFFPSFRFCDSIQLGKYFPEFIKFDFEKPYLLKVYHFEIEEYFKSTLPDLPFAFYTLANCELKIENEESFEAYEAEIYYLIDQIYQLKKNLSCDDENKKADLQRLLACIYVNLLNSEIAIRFNDILKENYNCPDAIEFYSKLKEIYE